MKRRAAALLLALLTLSGCSSMLNRSYRSVSPHRAQTLDAAGSDAAGTLRAETFGELVNDVQFFVSEGMPGGIVHLYGYPGSLDEDLEQLRDELLERDPLCCWALSGIEWERSHLISFEECRFTFRYRVDPTQISRIQSAIGTTAIRACLGQALSRYDRRLVLQTSSYYGREEVLLQLIHQAYYAQPGSALGYPEVSILLYPADHDGTRILAEIHFSYGSDPLLLEEHARRVADAAAALTQEAPGQGEEGCRLLCSRLAELNHYSPNGAASVFSALISGGADSEGMALALQLLCQESGIECLPVSGTLDGAPHWWNLVKVNGVWRHVDVTAFSAGRDFLFTDSQMSPRYVWQKEQYPACKEAEREASAVPSLFP